MTKDIERKSFEAWFESRYDAHFMQFALDLMYVDKHTQTCWEAWQAAKAQEAEKLEGCVVVPHGVLDLTRFMCKTWSEIDKFVYKNCSDIGQYPVIQGTQNQLNLSRIGEQQINANEINKGVKWLLEAPQEPANDLNSTNEHCCG